MRIVFVLPSNGGGGGAHSIVQESMGLRKLGLNITIATPRKNAAQFRVNYPELRNHGVSNPAYERQEDLLKILREHDLAIATTALSVEGVVAANEALDKDERCKLGYYVQDYEPLFYAPGTPEWEKAYTSYNLMRGSLVFAKTHWLCAIVEANHGFSVRRVQPSIDHETYFPIHRSDDGPIKITAMVRPQTPRRAPRRTLRALEHIAFRWGSDVEVTYFGCDERALRDLGIKTSAALTELGVLSRSQVANTLRHSDLFLDLSDFQAFGRTGLEGMACGCVPVLPIFGGADEYAEHGINSYIVDTRSDEAIIDAVAQYVEGRAEWRKEMRSNAVKTALRYSVAQAAYSEYDIVEKYLVD